MRVQGEVRHAPDGSRVRVFTVHPTAGGRFSCVTTHGEWPEPAKSAVSKYGALEVSRLTGGERWQHDITMEQTQVALARWRKACLRDGFTVAHPFGDRT